MKILAIETSCDETAVAVLEAKGEVGSAMYRVLGNALFSQAELHSEYGGVYPTLAKREHQKNLVPLTVQALHEAEKLVERGEESFVVPERALEKIREDEFKKDVKNFLEEILEPDIDLIAVTQGPGLEPALWTGVSFAEALGTTWNIPVIGIDHMEGHIVSGLLEKSGDTLTIKKTELPLLSLLISGGHTELVLMKDWFQYEILGKTKDDAVGEAFDKTARLLGLPYPGGPEISKQAASARTRGAEHDIVFPRPLIQEDTCDFSFSGLKTAVLYKLKEMSELTNTDRQHVAEAFEDAARDVLVSKTKRALEKTQAKTLVVGGGVAANTHIRAGLEELVQESFSNVTLLFPGKGLTGDNAIMIGVAAHLRHASGHTQKEPLKASGSQSLA